MAVPSRFRLTLAPLVERWFSKVAPFARNSLLRTVCGAPLKSGSVARRSLDPALYIALYEVIGHDGTLLDTLAKVVWRGVKRDTTLGRASLFPVLFLDAVLGSKLPSNGIARRIAIILDTVALRGAWDNQMLNRYKESLTLTKPTRSDMTRESTARERLQRSLERCWRHIQKVDVSKLFAFPVSDILVSRNSCV